MTSRRILFFCIVLFTSSVSIAQPFVDLFNTKYQVFPRSSFQGESKKNIEGAQFQAGILAPIVRENKDVFLFGMNYSLLHFKVAGDSSFETTLRSHGVHVGYNKQWENENWKTLLLFIVRANTRISALTSNDVQYGGVLLFNYKKNENLRYRFGLYYNREYFGNFFIPLVGIEWKINSSLNFFGDLPNSLNLEKKLNPKLYTGLLFLSSTASYRPDNSNSISDYVREGEKSIGHNQLKLYVNYYVTNHFVVYSEFGRTYGRNFQLFKENIKTDSPNSIFRKTTDTFLYNFGIAYRFRTEK